MHIKKKPFPSHFIVSRKDIWDCHLSLAAVGLLVKIISFPEDMKLDSNELQSCCGVDKKEFESLLQELAKRGHIEIDPPHKKGDE